MSSDITSFLSKEKYANKSAVEPNFSFWIEVFIDKADPEIYSFIQAIGKIK